MIDHYSPDAFGVDHYLPKRHFPLMRTEYANLYYACNRCNSRKREHWHGSNVDLRIPNPCDQVMSDHLRFDGALAAHSSKAGEFTVKLLDINGSDRVKIRTSIMSTVRLTKRKLDEIKRDRRALQRKVTDRSLPPDLMGDAQDQLAAYAEEIALLEAELSNHCAV